MGVSHHPRYCLWRERTAAHPRRYLDWQSRLKNYKASGLEVDVFCLQEGVSRSTFYRWVDRLKDGIPEPMVTEKAARQRAESGEAVFVPITLKASPVEIKLPNGGIVRPSVTVCVARGKRSETMFVPEFCCRRHKPALPAVGCRSGRAGGSHPSCGCAASLEGTEVMTNFSDVRIFLCTTPTNMN